MKKMLSVVFLLTSAQLLACPDLKGKWDCRDIDNSKLSFTFDQNGAEFLFQRQGERLLIIADEQTREVEETIGGSPVKAISYAMCEGTRLHYSTTVQENGSNRYVKVYNFNKRAQALNVSLYQDHFPGNDIYIASCQKR